MKNEEFLSHLKTHIGNEESPLRRAIANAVLRGRGTKAFFASDTIIKIFHTLAKESQAREVAKLLLNPSLMMIARINNTVYYNAHSVTRAPNVPNSPSKSPKYIADKTLEEMISILGENPEDA